MGANIIVSDNNKEAIVKGKTKLIGKEVKATDLRGGIFTYCWFNSRWYNLY